METNEERIDWPDAAKDREIPKCVNFAKARIVTGQMLVNGVPQDMIAETLALACPDCGRVIFKFPQGVDYMTAKGALLRSAESVEGIAKYCPECGRRLSYPLDEPIVMEVD